MTSITGALAQVKDDPNHLLDEETILHACREAGYTWRRRVLDPVTLMRLFSTQILHDNVACEGLKHLSECVFTATAYCRARQRLPLRVYQHVCRLFITGLCASAQDVSRAALWLGHRVLRIDGSGVSMPDTDELQRRFGQPGRMNAGCGFPVAHVLLLIDATTGLILDLIESCWKAHDASLVVELHDHIRPGDVLLGDRGFCSYVHLALISLRKAHAVMRLHQRIIVSFRPHRPRRRDWPKNQRKGQPTSRFIKQLGYQDQLVEYVKPTRRPDWLDAQQFAALPATMVLREVRYRITRRGFRTRAITLVTTLLEADRYSKQELAKLYHRRWQIETDLLALKQTLGMDVLHCRTVDGVLKEMVMFLIVYNLVRMVMLRSAQQQGVAPDRISFIDALRWLCASSPGEPIPNLVINPYRPGRQQPRVIKRRKDRYTYMTKPRYQLLELLLTGTLKA